MIRKNLKMLNVKKLGSNFFLRSLSTKIDKLKVKSDVEESLFISPKVQMLLSKITGFNINKIFSPKQVSVAESPKYKLVTDEQLSELQEESLKGANKLLQMPPCKKPWNIHNNDELIISSDQQIAYFEMDDSTYVFADISPGVPRRDRMLVMRDKEGVLRRCNREESDQILMLYYPQEGKMYNMPQMFQPQQLEILLGKQQYEYILNVACVQFEPDDPNYTRVTERTFEHILQSKQFEVLRSTRFYGSMAFYFLIHNKIDLLLAHQLSQNRLDDAVTLVQLYHIIHPNCKSVAICKVEDTKDNYQLIQAYILNDSIEKVDVQKSLDSYMTRNAPEEQISFSN